MNATVLRRILLLWIALLVLVSPESTTGQAPPAPEPAPQSASPPDPLVSLLQERIPRRIWAHDVPGLNVLVLRGGEELWSAAFGWADVEAGRPMTLDAVFRVESISKPVTAWGVVHLAESGALELDVPVQSQLGSWTPPLNLPPFTPRQLLSHTAGVGLGDYGARYPPEAPRPSLTESLESELVILGPPGEAFAYSDTGYNLLEALVQEVTGEDFGAWMKEQVLLPLGMRSSSFDWDPSFAHRVPIAYDLGGRRVEPYVYPGRGSGGLFSTVHDVGRFALADSVPAPLLTPVARPTGLYGVVAEGYALGHFTETLSDGRSAVWHGGQGYGWMTHVHIVPATGDAIVLLANSQRAWPLFAHILRAWSGSLGVAPVRMSRIVWAAPVAWGVIVLALGSAALLVAGVLSRRGMRPGIGRRFLRPGRPGPVPRLGALAVGIGLVGLVVWASLQDYLFLFSILPAATRWLGMALALLGGALVAWGVVPAGDPGDPG